MRLSIVTSTPPRIENVDGLPSETGIYRARTISESHFAGLLAQERGKPTQDATAIKRLETAASGETRKAEYAHEGKLYAHVLGSLHEFDETTGAVGAVVDTRRWAEPFAFERIVGVVSATL